MPLNTYSRHRARAENRRKKKKGKKEKKRKSRRQRAALSFYYIAMAVVVAETKGDGVSRLKRIRIYVLFENHHRENGVQ